MEIARRIKALALIVTGALLPITHLCASGDWFDEPPQIEEIFLDRLPAKTLGQIFVESLPVHPSTPLPNIAQQLQVIATEAEKAKANEQKDAVAKVDQLLASVRVAQFEGKTGGEDAGLLHDVRDALVSAPDEAAEYIRWRLENNDRIKPKIKRDSYGYREEERPSLPQDLLGTIGKRAEAAKGPMRAQWLYLQGAICFNYGKCDAALPYFERVLKEFPKHPRAEFALLMSGRCYLAESRIEEHLVNPNDQKAHLEKEGKESHAEALASFNRYLKLYPNGRLTADIYGWLGAAAWDEQNYLAALDAYIRQTEVPNHPEVLKSAVLMIERTLRRIAQNPDAAKTDEALALVARHPQVAIGMLYLVLGSPDAAGGLNNWNDEKGKNPADAIRVWRKGLLARLASTVAAQKESTKREEWQSRYLVILAQAASNRGKQEEALRLLAMAPKPDSSDDLIFAKALALQRSGKAKEAIAAFRLLLDRFPSSPLAPGTRVKLGMAYRDNHQSGLAIVELRKILDAKNQSTSEAAYLSAGLIAPDSELSITNSAIYGDVSNAESDQVERIVETLLNFAPLTELAEGVTSQELDPGYATQLRAVIAERALAAENFEVAKQFMTPAQYGLLAARIEQLTKEATGSGDPKERASRELMVGDAWAAATGKLLRAPLEIRGNALYRRSNGVTLGFHKLDAELESRDELRHATRWWLQAARSFPASPLSATARLRVLETMAKIAQNSSYGFTRARESDMPKVSRQVYDRLVAECPKSEETRHAAYWSLALNPLKRDQSGDYSTAKEPLEFSSDFGAFDYPKNSDSFSGNYWDYWRSIDRRVNQLRGSFLSLDQLTREVEDLRKGVAKSGDIDQFPLRNFLEDLCLFLHEPAVTPEIARRYIDLRLDVLNRSSWPGLRVSVKMEAMSAAETDSYSGDQGADAMVTGRIAKALADSKLKPIRDYLEFLNAAMIANHQIYIETGDQTKGEPMTYRSRDYPTLEKATRDLLKRYPHSRKRETARLLLARAVFRMSEPRLENLDIPVGGKPEEIIYDSVPKVYQREPLKPKRVLAELDAYDQEFPKGCYSGDIQYMRADVLRRTQDWKPALEICLRELKDGPVNLRPQFSLCLARIFSQLANSDLRPDLLADVQKNPEAVQRLQEYLLAANGKPGHPLALLGAYLGDRLGFAYPIPEKNKKSE